MKKFSCLKGFFVFLFFIGSFYAWAEEDKSLKGYNRARVVVDGAAVYQLPNFDSSIVRYLDHGQKVKVSRETFSGAGGLGSFYKLKLNRELGYIADVDVKAIHKKGSKKRKSRKKSKKSKKKAPKEDAEEKSGLEEPGWEQESETETEDSADGESDDSKESAGVFESLLFGPTYQGHFAGEGASYNFFGLKVFVPQILGDLPLELEGILYKDSFSGDQAVLTNPPVYDANPTFFILKLSTYIPILDIQSTKPHGVLIALGGGGFYRLEKSTDRKGESMTLNRFGGAVGLTAFYKIFDSSFFLKGDIYYNFKGIADYSGPGWGLSLMKQW